MRKFFITIILLLAILLPFSALRADEGVNTQGRFKMGGNVFFANGSQKMPFGYLDGLNRVSVSPGGGVGAGLLLGYGLHENLDLDFSAGYRINESDDNSNRVDGNFSAAYTKISLVPRIRIRPYMFIKFNAGVGYYMGARAELENRQSLIPTKISIKYDNALGYHAGAEYEYFLNSHLAFNMGLAYNWVDYEYDSAKINKVKVRLLDKRQSEPDGSGTEFILGLNYYF